MTDHKTYLGDSVYLDRGRYYRELVLTAEDGIRATNTIILEPSMAARIVRFLNEWEAEARRTVEGPTSSPPASPPPPA